MLVERFALKPYYSEDEHNTSPNLCKTSKSNIFSRKLSSRQYLCNYRHLSHYFFTLRYCPTSFY